MALAAFTVTDDDGTGTTGTAGTNAWLQSLLDLIDARWSELTVTSTGTQDNLSITSGGVEADVLRCTNASLLTITSIAAPASPAKPGKPLVIFSAGVGQVDINDSSAALGTAANRVITGVSGTISLGGSVGAALLIYDDTTDRWRVLAHTQNASVSYTPTFGGVTLGNGTVSGAYHRIGRIIHWQATLTLGGSSSVAAGPITVTLPVTASSTTSPIATTSGIAIDASGGPAYYAVNAIPNSTTVVSLTNNASALAGLGTTNPFTWVSTDVLVVGGWYIAA